MATVQQVTNIMGEFYHRNKTNEDWQPFFIAYDLSIPLSYLAWAGMVTPTEASLPFIDDTWKEFCKVFEIDPLASFDNLDEFEDFIDAVG